MVFLGSHTSKRGENQKSQGLKMLVSLVSLKKKIKTLGRLGYLPSEDEEFFLFLNLAYVRIAEDAKPFSLMRYAGDFEIDEPLVFLDRCNYIAYPPTITTSTQNIELDNGLEDLFVWCYLSLLNPEKKEYTESYKKGLAEYRGRRHNERFEKPQEQTRLSEFI